MVLRLQAADAKRRTGSDGGTFCDLLLAAILSLKLEFVDERGTTSHLLAEGLDFRRLEEEVRAVMPMFP